MNIFFDNIFRRRQQRRLFLSHFVLRFTVALQWIDWWPKDRQLNIFCRCIVSLPKMQTFSPKILGTWYCLVILLNKCLTLNYSSSSSWFVVVFAFCRFSLVTNNWIASPSMHVAPNSFAVQKFWRDFIPIYGTNISLSKYFSIARCKLILMCGTDVTEFHNFVSFDCFLFLSVCLFTYLSKQSIVFCWIDDNKRKKCWRL